ncbi:protein-export membrane protein SecF [Candidatus Dependentiae bacterium Noda2021]|nr:protein-export membrane protein SecF [Candidatus Dependentiae bacterium Noda2021]
MIDFVRHRFVAIALSLAFVGATIGLYCYKLMTTGQTFAYSVDFTGGAQVLLKFDKPVSTIKVREILEKSGLSGVTVREFSSDEVLVRIKELSSDANLLGENIKKLVQAEIPDNNARILQTELVGPGVGKTLRWNSILAVLISLIAILIYIAIRFLSPAFAIGAIVALAHDAVAMLAACLIFNREISVTVIGAMLAVLGYSINDTIVIFARIRDNLKKMPHASLEEVVNVSLNSTLRRTLLTSFATMLTVLAMFLLGGEALRDFSLILLVGIVFGTYSSIYIASPVMMMLYNKNK